MSMGALGATATSMDEKATNSLWSILKGDTYNEIVSLHDEYKRVAKTLDDQLVTINRLQAGPQKNAAMQLYDMANASLTQQFVTYRTLRDQYNEVVRMISMASLGFTVPKTVSLSGLGAIPAVVFAGMTLTQIFVAAGLTVALLWAITDLVAAFKGQSQQTQRYSNQIAQILAASGEANQSITSCAVKVAISAAIGLGVLILFKVMRKRGGSASAPAQLELKTVSGTVV
jgi:hypothetical protein